MLSLLAKFLLSISFVLNTLFSGQRHLRCILSRDGLDESFPSRLQAHQARFDCGDLMLGRHWMNGKIRLGYAVMLNLVELLFSLKSLAGIPFATTVYRTHPV
jgi:hypothetical protein